MAPDNDVLINEENTMSIKDKKLNDKKSLVFLIIGILGIIVGIGIMLFTVFGVNKVTNGVVFQEFIIEDEQDSTVYSDLTGKPLGDISLKNAPTFCIQTPNGTDGARPQVGLNEAGVIFEAIAEAGITRFAAIYQNPSSAIIGPIRSLRIYYLEWDTPFDCTIVHAGGSGDALEALAAGGYRDLTENYTYMYRGTYGSRLWNNLFTTSAYLKQFSVDRGYDTSEIKGFSRMTPSESEKSRIDDNVAEVLNILSYTEKNTSEIVQSVNSIDFRFGGWANFNVHYDYNAETNTYNRSYESGVAHDVYECPAEDLGERNPEDVCDLVQLSPSVVIAMMVEEGKADDGYHESIGTIGSGRAYIFQNGIAIAGTWNKDSINDQIRFYDENSKEVYLVPGQTFISAVPNYGSVEY